MGYHYMVIQYYYLLIPQMIKLDIPIVLVFFCYYYKLQQISALK
jgi:hypothetical protein